MHKRWRRLSRSEFQALWSLWRQGQTFETMSQALERGLEGVYAVVARHGGIPPRVRVRARRALSLPEREEISRGLAAGASVRGLARALGRAPSTISREIRRHGGDTRYRAAVADAQAWRWGARPQRCRLACHRRLCRVVAGRLRADWSPQQIAQWLVTTYPEDPTMRVSHETIYRTLYVQARGALKKELVAHLRRRRAIRQSRAAARRDAPRGPIPAAVSIADRPPSVNDRALPGHWEGDLLTGTQRSHIATLVERHSRYVLLVRLRGRETQTVVTALSRRVRRLPEGLMRSLTWDRGGEMAQHQRFTMATEVQVYFCDPRSPWQRGSNENTNGLLRQYFPKGTDLTSVTQQQLDAVAHKLNTRPRQTLGWRTPAAVLAATVASTG
jgi:IS30 family transposase